MPTIHFTVPGGTRRTLDADTRASAMQVATVAGLQSLVGECGRSSMCSHLPCLCRRSLVGLPAARAAQRKGDAGVHTSECLHGTRPSCQIRLTVALYGIVLRLPPTQQ